MYISFIIYTALSLMSPIFAALPPSEDPWYTEPDDLVSYPPGSIIRVRPDPLDLYAAIGTNLTSASYNILYRTSDSNQLPSFAVTTLFVPSVNSTTKQQKNPLAGLLSYQIPYNSPWVDASPSWTLASELNSTFSDIAAALEQGWYVSVPDFEGPNATFAVGMAEGHAVLDGLRAVTQSSFSPTATSSKPPFTTDEWKISLWGYSGGSIASEFAAELQTSYAPDIAIAGVAIGGLPTPINTVLDAVNESPYACLMVLGLWGYANAYPVFESYLLSRLTPEVRANGSFIMGRNMTFEEAVLPYHDVDIYSYFIGGRDDIQSSQLVSYFMTMQGAMGLHGLPTMPMFIYKAIHDQLSPIQYSDALVEKYCAAGETESEISASESANGNGTEGEGVRIWYERNTIGGHVAEEYNEDGRAVQFLVKAMNGELGAGWPNGAGQGCVVRNVTVGNDTSPDW